MKSRKRFFNKCFCDGFYTKSFLDISTKTNSLDNGSDVHTVHILRFDKSSAKRTSLKPIPSRPGEDCMCSKLLGGARGDPGACAPAHALDLCSGAANALLEFGIRVGPC